MTADEIIQQERAIGNTAFKMAYPLSGPDKRTIIAITPDSERNTLPQPNKVFSNLGVVSRLSFVLRKFYSSSIFTK